MTREGALEHLANIFGFGPEPWPWDKEVNELINKLIWIEQLRHIRGVLKGEGTEQFEVGDPGDGVILVFHDGVLIMTGYMSSRGSAYVAGAFDGEFNYRAGTGSYWRESVGDVCSSIAKSVWYEFRSMMPERIPQ